MCPIPISGIKHYADADVTYKDYVIPKGTVLLANTSSIHYDPERYDEPHTYKPERYLNHAKYSSEYAAQSDLYKRDHFSFGGGRRVCPGTRLAENTLNIAIANILWAFEIRPRIEMLNASLHTLQFASPCICMRCESRVGESSATLSPTTFCIKVHGRRLVISALSVAFHAPASGFGGYML